MAAPGSLEGPKAGLGEAWSTPGQWKVLFTSGDWNRKISMVPSDTNNSVINTEKVEPLPCSIPILAMVSSYFPGAVDKSPLGFE